MASRLRRLDALTPATASTLGLTLGAAAAAALLTGASSIAGAAAFVALLALAGALAWSGEPVAMPIRSRLSVEVVRDPRGQVPHGQPGRRRGPL